MIHMLSRFDLKPGTAIESFLADYREFAGRMRGEGLIESTGKIGRRELDTPMDTDDEGAQEYYVVMSFRDRRQLDAAYAHLKAEPARDVIAHAAVRDALCNFVFTCWRDLD